MWNARRILKEIASTESRRDILTAFWIHGEDHARLMATTQLAKALRFRDESIRRMPPAKKAELLASRIGSPELEETLEMALMLYHTHHANDLMAAFLEEWQIPNAAGTIEGDDYRRPSTEDARAAAEKLSQRFDRRAIALYLASAGLLMGEEWRAATWPVVDEIAGSLAPR